MNKKVEAHFRLVSRPDLVGPAIVVIIGIFLMVESPQYKLRAGSVIGPGFVPFWFGVAMIIFGVSTAVGAFMRAGRQLSNPPAVASGEEAGQNEADKGGGTPTAYAHDDTGEAAGNTSPDEGPAQWRRPALVFGASVAAVALTPLLGILVSFGLAAIAILRFIEREAWWLSVLVSAAIMVALYLLFGDFLKIPIPIGPWGF